MNGERRLTLRMSDGVDRKYPAVWLRDNCQCDKCFDHIIQIRRVTPWSVNLDVSVTKSEYNNKDCIYHVIFDDGHVGEFPESWLKERSFDTKERASRESERYCQKRTLWGPKFKNNIPTFQYNGLMTNDKELRGWIQALAEHGMCVVKDASSEAGKIEALGKRVAFLTPTHYGNSAHIRNKQDAVHTSEYLDYHADKVFYGHITGVVLLHCLECEGLTGGENVLADAFKAAYQMKEQSPDLYSFLSEHDFDFYDEGVEQERPYHYVNRSPMFRHNCRGELVQVVYGVHSRDSVLDLDIDDVDTYYRALSLFHSLLYSEENMITHTQRPGEILCIDNYRLQHGRKDFIMEDGGIRHLQTGALEWDHMYSKLRKLCVE